MSAWLQLTNIEWFRVMVASEPDEAKRRELERKLAEVEAEVAAEVDAELNEDPITRPQRPAA